MGLVFLAGHGLSLFDELFPRVEDDVEVFRGSQRLFPFVQFAENFTFFKPTREHRELFRSPRCVPAPEQVFVLFGDREASWARRGEVFDKDVLAKWGVAVEVLMFLSFDVFFFKSLRGRVEKEFFFFLVGCLSLPSSAAAPSFSLSSSSSSPLPFSALF